jgi:hypothetical protein
MVLQRSIWRCPLVHNGMLSSHRNCRGTQNNNYKRARRALEGPGESPAGALAAFLGWGWQPVMEGLTAPRIGSIDTPSTHRLE